MARKSTSHWSFNVVRRMFTLAKTVAKTLAWIAVGGIALNSTVQLRADYFKEVKEALAFSQPAQIVDVMIEGEWRNLVVEEIKAEYAKMMRVPPIVVSRRAA